MINDLTVGKPSTVLWKFCLPLFGSVIFQQLYNIADSFVAGKFVGEDALAAVGNSYEITMIFIAFAIGCNIGCSVIVSQLFGAGKYSDLKSAVTTSLIACNILCAMLMCIGFFFDSDLLRMIHTPEDLMYPSKLYLDIYTLGLPFVIIYNISNGIFSALGDSRTPFVFLMCSSLANIGADILFTTAFSSFFTTGVDGVAWATFLCQGVSCVLAVVFVFKRLKTLKTGKYKFFSLPLLGKFSAIAIPSILQQSFVSVGNIIIQGIINTFGKGVIAGYSASVKINTLAITSFSTIGNGISNYTAQNIGAKKLSRIKEGYSFSLKMMLVICIPLSLLYFFAGKYILLLFLKDPSVDAIKSGVEFLQILSPFYCVIYIKLISDGVLRGAGMMRKFVITTFSDLVLRVALAILLSKTFLGSTGIWIGWPMGWCLATAISFFFYSRGPWNKISA